MKGLIEYFVRQGLFVYLITISVILVGAVAMVLLKREVFPNVNFDILSITTVFPGGSAEEVERLVTNQIERELREIDGFKRVRSYSIEGVSTIVVEVDSDQRETKEVRDDIIELINRLSDLPEDAEDPVVTLVESRLTPVVEVHVLSELPALEHRKVAKQIGRSLERVPGVARVDDRGLRDLEIHVEVEPAALARYQLSLEDVVRAIRNQNLSISAGVIESRGDREGAERIVRTVGDYKDIRDVENTVVRANDLGEGIRIGALGKVRWALERTKVLSRTDGVPSITLTVLKQESADVLRMVGNLKTEILRLSEQYQGRAELRMVDDKSIFIERRLNVLSGNLLTGVFLILLVLTLVLHWRAAVVVSVGVPFAFLGALICFLYLGLSLNVLTLLGLIIVTGMLVDNAVVVTDNAILKMEEGLPPREAAIRGAYEVWGAVSASCLTTVVVFVPMLFMTGIFGKFVWFIPPGVIAALVVSLIQAFLLIPRQVADFVRPPRRSSDGAGNSLDRIGGAWERSFKPVYLNLLARVLHFRYAVLAVVAVGTLFTFGYAKSSMPFILFPPDGVEIFFIKADAPRGTSVERLASLLVPIETELSKLPKSELQNFETVVGKQQQDSNDPERKEGSEYGMIRVFLTPQTARDRKTVEIVDALRTAIGSPPGFERLVFQQVKVGPPTGKPVSLGVRGDRFEDVLPAVATLKKLIHEIPGTRDVVDTYLTGKEEIQVRVDPEELAAARLTVGGVGTVVRAAYEGVVASTIRELDEEIDVRVMLPESYRSNPETLQTLKIPNPTGNLIPLSRVSRTERAQSISTYQHEEFDRQISVTAELDLSVTDSTKVNAQIQRLLPDVLKNHPNVLVDFGGESRDTRESLNSLFRTFGVAMLLVFIILVLTFQSLLQPFLVMLTIPLGIVTVIWTLTLHNRPLSFMALLGIIALVGVIVNNAIVFIDFVNQKRREGFASRESILAAGAIRIRPIFLTTITTVFGLLPTAYGIGGLDPFVVPIAMALAWGLLAGSVLTAFVIPTSIAVLDDLASLRSRILPQSNRLSALR